MQAEENRMLTPFSFSALLWTHHVELVRTRLECQDIWPRWRKERKGVCFATLQLLCSTRTISSHCPSAMSRRWSGTLKPRAGAAQESWADDFALGTNEQTSGCLNLARNRKKTKSSKKLALAQKQKQKSLLHFVHQTSTKLVCRRCFTGC